MTPVIVIARTSVIRRRDLADEIQRLRRKALVFHEIAGEEHNCGASALIVRINSAAYAAFPL